MRDATEINGFHAHVYYDESTRERAATLRGAVEARFDVTMGRWRDEPVGPHPQSMYQIAFAPEAFSKIVPFLMLNRQGLDVLVHPETGDEVPDHTDQALWLGDKLVLNIEFLREHEARQAAEHAAGNG